MRLWMKIIGCVVALACIAQVLDEASVLPTLDQQNINIDNNGSGWILDGDFRVQQGVRAGCSGVLTSIPGSTR